MITYGMAFVELVQDTSGTGKVLHRYINLVLGIHELFSFVIFLLHSCWLTLHHNKMAKKLTIIIFKLFSSWLNMETITLKFVFCRISFVSFVSKQLK